MTHDSASPAPSNPQELQNFRIKSFARRQGRITLAQQKALDELWVLYGIDSQVKLEPHTHFGNSHPIVLEIGFGNGDSLVEMAKNDPQRNYVGIEVHRPGVGHLLIKTHEAGIHNLRVYAHDAIDILNDCIADDSLERVQLFFLTPGTRRAITSGALSNKIFSSSSRKSSFQVAPFTRQRTGRITPMTWQNNLLCPDYLPAKMQNRPSLSVRAIDR